MTGQANFLQSLGWAVLNSLWQLALLWVIYQLITGISRKMRPATKTSLATGLLIAGFGWFVYTFFATYYYTADHALITASLVSAPGNEQLNEWLSKSLPFASMVYLALLVLPLLNFIRNYRYVQVIRSYGLTRINVDWRLFVNRVAAQMNIRKKVQVWISGFVSSPVTVGFLKPVILVPLAAVNHLSPQQLEAVLLHELSHIRRYDYFFNLLINFIQAVLYFNPFVKAFVRIVEKEREKSCDEMVLQFQYDSHEYASALLTLEKANRENKQLAIAASGKKNDLLHRVELILGVHKKPLFSFNKLAGLMAGLLCFIGLNIFVLLSRPSGDNQQPGFTAISPLNFIEAGTPQTDTEDKLVDMEENTASIENKIASVLAAGANMSTTEPAPLADQPPVTANPNYINVSLELAQAPVLKKYQEDQVDKALLAARKILSNVQWKAVEKNIAEVFSQQEKEQLKKKYEKEVAKLNWEKLENQLKMAYDQIDWEKMNSQLGTVLNQYRLDSIQRVYNHAISQLNGIASELQSNNMNGIPDTDISLQELATKKQEMQKALNELKRVRSKKIVHL